MSSYLNTLAGLRLPIALLIAASILPASANDFTGIHAGVLLGVESGHALAGDFDIPVAGEVAGLEIGATYQFDNGWVVGVAADVARSFASGQTLVGNYITYEGMGEMSATLRGRLGYAMDSVLPYLTAGLGYTRTSASQTCAAGAGGGLCQITGPFTTSVDDARFGYVLGAGLEVALTDNISVKTEYLYSDYGTAPMTLVLPLEDPLAVTTDVTIRSSTIRSGVMFRF